MAHPVASYAWVSAIPPWLVQTILGMILSGGIAWCTWTTVISWKHEVRVTAVEYKVNDIHDDIGEMKSDVKEMNRKLDRLIERGNSGIRPHQ